MNATRIGLPAVFLLLASLGPVRADDIEKIDGHKGHVRAVAFSPDGKWLLSGGADNELLLWDAKSGKLERSFKATQTLVIAAVFSRDGKRIACADHFNRVLRVFDTASGKEEKTFAGHTERVHCVAFSPDGARLASIAYDSSVRIWNVETGKELKLLTGHMGEGACVRFSPDGRRLVSSATDGTIRLWNAASGRELAVLTGHKRPVIWTEFARDGRSIVSAGHDGTVRLWETLTGKERLVLSGHKGWVRVATFAPDGRAIASAGQDRTVRVWDALTGKELERFEKHKGMVWSVAWSPDGKRLASGGDDNLIRLYAVGARAVKVAPELSPKELDVLWTDLGNVDAVKAYVAIGRLAESPKQSLPFLTEKLTKLGPTADAAALKKMLADLGAEEFKVRETAMAGLTKLGATVKLELEHEMTREGISPEANARLIALLHALPEPSANERTSVRAMEALEGLGDKMARAALERLARDAGNPGVRREAAGALERAGAAKK